MRFVVEAIYIGGGLPELLGASCSGSALSAPVVSVSMSIVLRSAKKSQVDIALGDNLTTADVGTSLADFLAVCEIPLDMPLASLYFMEVVIMGR
jgi:hypothetical protein